MNTCIDPELMIFTTVLRKLPAKVPSYFATASVSRFYPSERDTRYRSRARAMFRPSPSGPTAPAFLLRLAAISRANLRRNARRFRQCRNKCMRSNLGAKVSPGIHLGLLVNVKGNVLWFTIQVLVLNLSSPYLSKTGRCS